MVRISFSGKGGATKHSELTDVSTPHVLADLESAVCSEAEAAGLASTVVEAIKVSDTLRNSNDPERTQAVTGGQPDGKKAKETKLNADLSNVRIKFDIHSDGSINLSGAVHINGVIAAGGWQSTTSASYVTKTADLAGLSTDDLIQIYLRSEVGGTHTCYTRNFRFYYDPDDKMTHIGGKELETELVVVERDPTISMTNQDP